MIKSVHKALQIMSYLADNYETPIALSEISAKMGMNKSTCCHIINTLVNDGYVARVPGQKGYILGPAAYCLSRFGNYKSKLVTISRPILRYLYKKLGYSIILSVIEGDEKYILDYIDDGTVFKSKEKIRKDDIYRTATGRVILSNMPADKIYSVYNKHGNSIENEYLSFSSLDEMISEISKTKKNDVLKSRNVYGNEIHIGYGAAIFDTVDCVGAIGVAIYTNKEDEEEFMKEENKVKTNLKNAAKEITRRLSYR